VRGARTISTITVELPPLSQLRKVLTDLHRLMPPAGGRVD
jgi:hypothetical protein